MLLSRVAVLSLHASTEKSGGFFTALSDLNVPSGKPKAKESDTHDTLQARPPILSRQPTHGAKSVGITR